MLAVADLDGAVYILDIESDRVAFILEGHTSSITSTAFSSDGLLLASKSLDRTVRIWRRDSWETICILAVGTSSGNSNHGSISFHPKRSLLATPSGDGIAFQIWDVSPVYARSQDDPAPVRYTTAKIVLVGDSGVGKTGLGWKLATGEFKEHSSTHGQQFWVIDAFGTKRADGAQCEAVLWDLAGQPDYRLVHALLLDDVDLALILFDPTNRQDALGSVEYWLKQLQRSSRQWRAILVGARIDRGSATFTDKDMSEYCTRLGIGGGFLATSARTGLGILELTAAIKSEVRWDTMPATVTTVLFKLIREYVLSIKQTLSEDTVWREILTTPDQLRRRLEDDNNGLNVGSEEMMATVKHLETHGYVTILKGSLGDISILLAPDLLGNLASSFVLEARRHPAGLGVLEEGRLLESGYNFPELTALSAQERRIMVDATVTRFLERNICFRESLNDRVLLVFPSLINERRAGVADPRHVEDVAYRVSGPIENIYSSLVVLLGYTNRLTRKNQWRYQAEYEIAPGQICGFRQTFEQEGEIELVLYYGATTSEDHRAEFRSLFERFLNDQPAAITSYEPIICRKCSRQQERLTVINHVRQGLDFIHCSYCGEIRELRSAKISAEQVIESGKAFIKNEQEVARHRTAFAAALVRVKSMVRDKIEPPSCYLCYAWDNDSTQRWVSRLAQDLRDAGIQVAFDGWNSAGSSLSTYINKLFSMKFVLVIGTPKLLAKFNEQNVDNVVKAELRSINLRLMEPAKYGETVIPILRDGDQHTSFFGLLCDLILLDFRLDPLYFRSLLDLIWRLYTLPFDSEVLEELRAAVSPTGAFKSAG